MKTKKFLWGALLVVSMLICISATAYIVTSFLSENNNVQYIATESSSAPNDFIENNTVENHNINWSKIQKANSDVYAWIYIPKTNIDYAIVQATGDETDTFYLNRNLEKEYEFAGSIFSEKQTSRDFSDPVTLIYGHNMKNGSMFATLHKFEDPDFFKKNKYIYIYTPDRRLTYKIYSAYIYDDRHILNSFDFSNKEIREQYFSHTLNPDSVSKNTRKADLNPDSKIITLSTCTNGAANTRYLVQGVLIKDENTHK